MQTLLLIDNKPFNITGFSILSITEAGKRWPVHHSAQRVGLFIGYPNSDRLKPIADTNYDVLIILDYEEPQEESEGDALYDAVVMACHLYKPHAIFTSHGVGTLVALHRPTKEAPWRHVPILAEWTTANGEHILYGSVSQFAVPPFETAPQI